MLRPYKLILLLIGIILLTSCGKKKLDISQVRGYSDSIVENILEAVNEDDYEKYSADFNDTMKDALTKDVFISQNKIVKNKIGSYVSKDFGMAQREKDYIVVLYKAKFTKEPKDVIVKIVYENNNGNIKVAGLFFDSPNLRKK